MARHTLQCTRILCKLLLLSALFSFSTCHAAPKTGSVPFRQVKSMILVDAEVNGHHAVLLLDTGATYSVISSQLIGATVKLDALAPSRGGAGSDGDAVSSNAKIVVGANLWFRQPVFVMNLDAVSKRLGVRVDGLLGQDLLRGFQTVTIDYKNHTLTLE